MEWVNKLNSGSAWLGHMEYARKLVADNKFKSICELGTYGGHSLFSFAQGMKDVGVKGKLIAIDKWEGGGDYGSPEQLENIKRVASEVFPDQEFRFIQKSFNDARVLVKNNSVDVLHIDGMHDYNSVKEDFEHYIGKVKVGGYILMHDTQVKDRGAIFEVYKFFEELKSLYPTWDFEERIESFGLGIIKKNGKSL